MKGTRKHYKELLLIAKSTQKGYMMSPSNVTLVSVVAELRRPQGPPSAAPYSIGKEKAMS